MKTEIIDQYSSLWVRRLFLNEETNTTIAVKKKIYLSEVLSFEEGDSAEFDWQGDTMFVVCNTESFYCAGSVTDFEKQMNNWIAEMRKKYAG